MMKPTAHAIWADRIFDGTKVHDEFAAVIQGPRIVAIVPQRAIPRSMPVRRLPDGAWLAPGFIDAQVNGGGDVLFNDEPTPHGNANLLHAAPRFQTTSLMPALP